MQAQPFRPFVVLTVGAVSDRVREEILGDGLLLQEIGVCLSASYVLIRHMLCWHRFSISLRMFQELLVIMKIAGSSASGVRAVLRCQVKPRRSLTLVSSELLC